MSASYVLHRWMILSVTVDLHNASFCWSAGNLARVITSVSTRKNVPNEPVTVSPKSKKNEVQAGDTIVRGDKGTSVARKPTKGKGKHNEDPDDNPKFLKILFLPDC